MKRTIRIVTLTVLLLTGMSTSLLADGPAPPPCPTWCQF